MAFSIDRVLDLNRKMNARPTRIFSETSRTNTNLRKSDREVKPVPSDKHPPLSLAITSATREGGAKMESASRARSLARNFSLRQTMTHNSYTRYVMG